MVKKVIGTREYYGMKLSQKLLLSTLFLIFIGINIAIWSPFINFDTSKMLSASSTLFSILAGFFIASAMANYLRLKTLLSSETGVLFSMYRLSDVIDKSLSEDIANKIDKYIIAGFDWELDEYIENTQKEFSDILDVYKEKEMKLDSEKEHFALEFLTNNFSDLPSIRNEISVVAKTTLNKQYWTLLIVLGFLTILSVMFGTDLTFISIASSVAVSVAVVFALFLLNEIDRNKLNESDIAFSMFNQLLESIGKLPYYLEADIKSGRVRPEKSKEYRVCKYLDSSKEVVVVKPS